jgi:hypothetical protein
MVSVLQVTTEERREEGARSDPLGSNPIAGDFHPVHRSGITDM